MFIKVTSELTPGILEVKEYHPAHYGAPGRRRQKKRFLSPEAVKRQNEKNKARHVQNMILLNFDRGYHIVLRYRESPETYEEAEERFKLFTLAMRRRLEKKGHKFKYIGITERGKHKQVLHHHIIVQRLEGVGMVDEVRDAWEKNGNIAMYSMYEQGNYEKLAEYFVKIETKEEQKGTRYHISRGLKKPKVISKETIAGEISEPDPPRGWYLDPTSLISAINPYTGKRYQRYFLKNTPQIITQPEKKEEPPEEKEMNKPQLNLYIESQVKKGKGSCIYVLEYLKNGEPVTLVDSAVYEGDKAKLALMAMIAALLRVKTPSKIKIFSSCTVIRGAFKNKWLDKWQDNGWKTNKGGQVAHAGLWKYIAQISKDHDLIAAADDDMNTYKSWMLNQLNKKEE